MFGFDPSSAETQGLPDPHELEADRQRRVVREWGMRIAGGVLLAIVPVNMMLACALGPQMGRYAWAIGLTTLLVILIPAVILHRMQLADRRADAMLQHRALVLSGHSVRFSTRWKVVSTLRKLTGLGLAGLGVFGSLEEPAWGVVTLWLALGLPAVFRRSWDPTFSNRAATASFFAPALVLSAYFVDSNWVMFLVFSVLALAGLRLMLRPLQAGPLQALSRLSPAFREFASPLDLAQNDVEEGRVTLALDRLAPFLRVMEAGRVERTILICAAALRERDPAAARELLGHAAHRFPKSAKVYAALAVLVEDSEHALLYAQFSESNASRQVRTDITPYRELRERLER